MEDFLQKMQEKVEHFEKLIEKTKSQLEAGGGVKAKTARALQS